MTRHRLFKVADNQCSGAYMGLVHMLIMFKETVPEIEGQLIEILVKWSQGLEL